MRNALILIALVIVGTYLAWTKSIPFGIALRAPRGLPERGQHPQGLAGADRRRQRRQGRERQERLRERPDRQLRQQLLRGHLHGRLQRPADPQRRPGRDPAAHLPGGQLLPRRAAREPERAATSPSGDTIPVTQTSTAVQLDQILTSLQAPDRANLQKLLEGYGQALNHKPTAADDATQDPEVQGLTAAQAINKSFDLRRRRRPGTRRSSTRRSWEPSRTISRT